MSTFPPFLRFNDVILWYSYGLHPIVESCEFIESHLLTLKSALNDSIMIAFVAEISQNYCHHFNDDSKLIKYIRNRFLPIFDSPRSYTFNISCISYENVVTSLLQMDEIKRCSNVDIRKICGEYGESIDGEQMPMEMSIIEI